MSYIFGRILKVEFYSSVSGEKIEYSTADETRSLVMEVNGSKHLSLLRDEFIIDIYNLNYHEVIRLIKHNFDRVEISAGYESGAVSKIFKGKIFYISMGRDSRETSIAHIICISEMAGIYNHKLNLSINSGINIFSAINYMVKKSGIRDVNLSEALKRKYIEEANVYSGSPSSIVEEIIGSQANFISQGDSSHNTSINIWDIKRSDRRKIKVDMSAGMVVNGPPVLTTDGISFESLPVINYMPGDILLVENRIINMAITSLQEAQSTNLGRYLATANEDGFGEYILYRIEYNLSNNGEEFSLKLFAKSASLLFNMLGGT